MHKTIHLGKKSAASAVSRNLVNPGSRHFEMKKRIQKRFFRFFDFDVNADVDVDLNIIASFFTVKVDVVAGDVCCCRYVGVWRKHQQRFFKVGRLSDNS